MNETMHIMWFSKKRSLLLDTYHCFTSRWGFLKFLNIYCFSTETTYFGLSQRWLLLCHIFQANCFLDVELLSIFDNLFFISYAFCYCVLYSLRSDEILSYQLYSNTFVWWWCSPFCTLHRVRSILFIVTFKKQNKLFLLLYWFQLVPFHVVCM
jgi:hypothetical protein